MPLKRQFKLDYDSAGVAIDSNTILELQDDVKMRVFPVDAYEFPEEIKKKAQEWHVIKVPLLGQRIDGSEGTDWCGRTSASMVYNYFQLLKGGDPRERYITHSRAGSPKNTLDLRYPTGHRAFFQYFADQPELNRGWNRYPSGNYEVTSTHLEFDASRSVDGEIPLPLSQLLGSDENKRPKGIGGVLRYLSTSDDAALEGRLLPTGLRDAADRIAGDEDAIRERFAHIIKCLRANNPVVIYTGIGTPSDRFDRPLHIIVICGYCILKTGGKSQLWLVTADPSAKKGLASANLLSAPNPTGNCDLGHELSPEHGLFRIQSGIFPKGDRKLLGFASLNLVRGGAFFKVNPTTQGTPNNRFLDHKDRTGGYYIYRERQTHAPAEVIDSSFGRPRYVFPLRGGNAANHPWQCYYNNESLDTGIGGYYVLGLQRNLHGGVHLFPPAGQDFTPVSAIAPGYIVAARLPSEEASCLAPGVAEAIGNWPGFVLVRHEVEERPKDEPPKNAGSKEEARKGVFYTLYMHLRSPAFPADLAPAKPESASARKPADTTAFNKYLQEVPWFRELYKRRFGAWVNVSAVEKVSLGALFWSQGPVSDADQQPPTAGRKTPTNYWVLPPEGPRVSISVPGEPEKVQWLYKGPPGNLVEALKQLAAGKVVTFDEPFFPVGIGEVLGLAGPLPAELAPPPAQFPVRPTEDVPTRRKQFSLRSGFLHFQVFVPEGGTDNGLALITELAKELDTGGGKAPEFFEVKEDQEDNFLEVKEIEGHLKRTLPQEDREPFSKATSDLFAAAQGIPRSSMGYGPRVASLLDSKTSFAHEAEPPDWTSPCCRFAYPLKLEVEPLYLPTPDQNPLVSGGSYELELCFEQETASGEWQRMECTQGGCGGELNGRKVCKPAVLKLDANKVRAAKNGVIPLSLKVPVLADRMTLKARQGFFIEQSVPLPGADGRLLAQGITRRWRNVRLIQKNEWTPGSVKGVLGKLNAALDTALQKPAEEAALQIAWCDSEKEAHIERLPSLRTEQATPSPEPEPPGAKLFTSGGWLPPDRKLENLHPVTAVWLLNVLDKQKRARVRDEWTVPSFRKEDPRPLGAGWMRTAGERRVGETATVIVIDEDFGYDKQNRVTLLATTKDGHELCLARGREFAPGGNIVQEVPTSFWGNWTLVVADTSEPPQALEPRSRLPVLDAAISVPRPKLIEEQTPGEPAILEKPQRQADGSWRWLLRFEDTAPLMLPAFILMRTHASETGPGTLYPERVLPVTARPLAAVMGGPPIDEDHFVLDEDKSFITGLTDAGLALWKSGTLFVIKDLVRFKTCFEVADIQVGWSLVKGLSELKAKRLTFTLKSLSQDGMTCVLESSEEPARFALEGVTVRKPSKNRRELTFTPAPCEDPKLQALWVFDERREHVLARGAAAAKSRLGPFLFSDYQQAYRATPALRMHVSLASALSQLASALKSHPVIERIEASGLHCIINAAGKGVAERVYAAAAAGCFEVNEATPGQKTRLRISANPATLNWMVASFHPGRIFDDLTKSKDLQPGTELFYWFELAALNGQSQLHFFGGETTGEGDGAICLAEFEALASRTSQHIRATHAEPGRYRKVGFRDMVMATEKEPARQLAFKPSPQMGQCEVEITACVSGAPEDLGKYTAVFSRKLPGKSAFEPLKGFTKVLPQHLVIRDGNGMADWLVWARVPYPQPDGSQKNRLDGKTGFKLELVATETDREPQHLEVTGTYDFTPRWVGGLGVEQKGELLELRCHAEGVEVPVQGSKDKRAWSVAREFQVIVKPDKADPHLAGVKPKLSQNIRYATPTLNGTAGGCDPQGDFVATVDLKALEPGVAYTFTVQRPNGENKKPRPVRMTDMEPCVSHPFTRTQE